MMVKPSSAATEGGGKIVEHAACDIVAKGLAAAFSQQAVGHDGLGVEPGHGLNETRERRRDGGGDLAQVACPQRDQAHRGFVSALKIWADTSGPSPSSTAAARWAPGPAENLADSQDRSDMRVLLGFAVRFKVGV